MSNLDVVLAQLKQEHAALGKAIAALEGVSFNGTHANTKRTMSPAARRKISAAQKHAGRSCVGQKRVKQMPFDVQPCRHQLDPKKTDDNLECLVGEYRHGEKS
jgi:hypothetical protein